MPARKEDADDRMAHETPAERFGRVDRDAEIGATAGQTHADVLTRALGREDGLAAATGVGYQKPVVVERERAHETGEEEA